MNFTPSTTEPGSPASTMPGVVNSKIEAFGVTAFEAPDAGPVPAPFVAVTLNV